MISREKEQMLKRIIDEDADVLAEIEAAKSEEAFCEVFAKRGLEFSQEEANILLNQVVTASSDDELNEDVLETVAGGGFAALAWGIGARVGIAGRMVYDYYKCGNAFANYSVDQLISGKFW